MRGPQDFSYVGVRMLTPSQLPNRTSERAKMCLVFASAHRGSSRSILHVANSGDENRSRTRALATTA